jgi:hypothetical protein
MTDARSARYTTKTNPATIAQIVAATLPGQRRTFADPRGMSNLTSVEHQTQGLLNATTPAIPTILYPSYLAFVRKLWSLRRRGITGTALRLASTGLRNVWSRRNLSTTVLTTLADQLFGLGLKGTDMRNKLFIDCDFLNLPTDIFPWNFDPIAGGSLLGNFTGEDLNHPGNARFRRAAAANSGASIDCGAYWIQLAGNESADAVLRFQYLANLYGRFGYYGSLNTLDIINNGVWLVIDTVAGVPGTVKGYAAIGTDPTGPRTTSATPTSYVVATGAWYRFHVDINDTGTLANYTIYDMDSNILWTDTISTNLPVATSGHNTSHGAIFIDTVGGSGASMVYIDYLSAEINRTLIR